MHPVSVLTLGIFLAGYITARWDLVTRLYELAIFAWDHGVIVRSAALDIAESSITDFLGIVDTRGQRVRNLEHLLRPVLDPHRPHRESRGRVG